MVHRTKRVHCVWMLHTKKGAMCLDASHKKGALRLDASHQKGALCLDASHKKGALCLDASHYKGAMRLDASHKKGRDHALCNQGYHTHKEEDREFIRTILK